MSSRFEWQKVKGPKRTIWLGLVLAAWFFVSLKSIRGEDVSDPIVVKLSFPSVESQLADVQFSLSANQRDHLDFVMPIWSPGFYRVEDYASKVQDITAKDAEGNSLEVRQDGRNRWRVTTEAAKDVVLSYRLLCKGQSVTTNWVSQDLLVLNGPATFLKPVDVDGRPFEIQLELAKDWTDSATGLPSSEDGMAHHYRANDYDTLVDSPIVAGKISKRSFHVAGHLHQWVDAGDFRQWDSARATEDIAKIVEESSRYWGTVPFDHYVFLNVFRQGGGGLEHGNSTLLTSSPKMAIPNLRWLSFVSHEYFHAYNVKRLRPIELSRLDYEQPPSTESLWVSEGLTTYGADLIVVRAGLCSTADFLGSLSSHIGSLQNSPGRLKQTLEQASLDVWSSGTSGVGRDTQNLVSYYVKGPVVGWLLDATIQKHTNGKRSLDDVMRLAYQRYSGKVGFTAEQFREIAEEIAEHELKPSFQSWLGSTDELDYAEALD